MNPQTSFFSFSTAKGVAALIAHLLVRDGLVGYDTPVAEVWPEFGVHGKQTATLRQVLTHAVGVPAMPGGLGPTDLADWPRVCAAIAGAQPRWRPGTRTGSTPSPSASWSARSRAGSPGSRCGACCTTGRRAPRDRR